MKKYKKLFFVLLVVAAVVSIASAFSFRVGTAPWLNDSVTLVPGQNIALVQDTGNNTVTVVGAATWSLSGLTADQVNVTYLRSILVPDSGMDFEGNIKVFYGKSVITLIDSFFGRYISIFYNTTGIKISDGYVNVTGSMYVNSKNLEQELARTSIKSFQADFINSSGLYSDKILIPQDVTLTNISFIVDRVANASSHVLNISLEKYTSYPSSKYEVFNYSFNSTVNEIDGLNYDFNNKDKLFLNYTAYVNVSASSSMFKFKVR